MKQYYEEQLKLLVRVLLYISREEFFALKGGTAINLFIRDFPRLSIDIDLVYLGFEDRQTAFQNINNSLFRITNTLQKVGIKSTLLGNKEHVSKIICFTQNASIKIEPNYVLRGYVFEPQMMRINPKVEEKFGFANIKIISHAELYGGKICAALDRQHPRDLFDVKYLLNNEGITDSVKQGFIVALLSHNRPPYELLQPNIKNQKNTFNKEFVGMSDELFTYQDHLQILNTLIKQINQLLNQSDKEFLLSFFNSDPNWELMNISNLPKLPAINWKLQNLKKLKEVDNKKLSMQLQKLHDVFQKTAK